MKASKRVLFATAMLPVIFSTWWIWAQQAQARQLGLGNQMTPAYSAPNYSPVFPNYHQAPVIGGFAPNTPPPTYEPTPSYQPTPYPQYLAPGSTGNASRFNPPQ
jgi:hypothetical protein